MKYKINPGDVIAVGDIHANWNPYSQFLNWVDNTGAVVVLLGDLIDRGGEDVKVLEATYDRFFSPESFGLQALYVVKGNHEKMFLDAVRDSIDLRLWIENGGNFDAFSEMRCFSEWINSLPLYIRIGSNLFMHAGFHPGTDPQWFIENGKPSDMLWVRRPFLDLGPQFDLWNPSLKRVFHGHTPRKNAKPDILPDRVNLDTGACFKNGKLTAFNVNQDYYVQF